MEQVLTEGLLEGKDLGFSVMELLVRFGINILAVFMLVRVIYYPRHKNKDFLFTFFLFNCLNFLICFLLSATKIKIGFAFGLFAIFSIMRYRTVVVPVKEMGYFFVCVSIGIINALATVDDNFVILICCNLFILVLTIILDRFINLTHENVKEMVYERIDLIHPDKRSDMLEDINKRTGLPVHRVDIIRIDFLKDVAVIHCYYYSKENETKMAGVIDDD
ncbi:MAG: DUF4956 domain-containing protein [Flavipsychrobacter sp.]|nr:DUF4956 domain-containing protein [Flavipsychrobacter sp.]